MNVDAHRAKALRIERSLAKLGADDAEMTIEAAMLAGTHWFNIVLHAQGLRASGDDAMHAEFIWLAERRKLAVRIPGPLAAMDAIEALRTTHVRGDLPDAASAARRALAALTVLREAAQAVTPEG